MHRQARQFVRELKRRKPEHFNNVRVSEVGSLNINGSCRDMFNAVSYVGYDISEGEGVDYVGRFTEHPIMECDVCFSTEALEHDSMWAKTFEQMYDSVCENGLVFFTCATTGRGEHGTHDNNPESSPETNDYYMNLTERDFYDRFDLDEMFADYEFEVNEQSHDLYFWGIK